MTGYEAQRNTQRAGAWLTMKCRNGMEWAGMQPGLACVFLSRRREDSRPIYPLITPEHYQYTNGWHSRLKSIFLKISYNRILLSKVRIETICSIFA